MKRYKVYPEHNLYFTTNTIISWLHVFTEEKYFRIIIDSLEYCISNKGLLLPGYVIMPNHVHLLTANTESTNLSDIMRDFKHYTSGQIARELEVSNNRLFLYIMKKKAAKERKKQDYKVWQDDFHPQIIYSENWFRQKLDYMHHNPVRKGYVVNPEYWKYSSARNWILEDDSIIRMNWEFFK